MILGFDTDLALKLGLGFVLLGGLFWVSWIDYKTYRLPDKYTLPLIALGCLANGFVWNHGLASLIGAAAGYGFFVAIEIVFKTLRGKDGLGRGDAKLLAVGGAWCTWSALPYIVLIASVIGILAVLRRGTSALRKDTYIPFGPALSLAIAIVWIAIQTGYILIL